MRIAFVISTNTSGGAERVITTLANYFAESGDSVLMCNFDADSSFYPVNSKVKIIKFQKKYPKKVSSKIKILRIYNIYKKLCDEFEDFNPEVVIPFLFNSEFPTINACLKLGIPCITSVRNTPEAYPKYQILFRKIMYPRLAGVVLQSNKVLNHSYFAKVKNKCVIMNPTAYKRASQRKVIDQNKIISVGRLNEQKNHSLLISAFSKIASKYPNLVLHIYGEGELRRNLLSLIDKLGMNNRIVLEGAVENAIMRNADARLFVMTSNYEGFPNALLEAMCCHIPVICSNFDTGIAKELLGDNDNGLLFEVGNEKDLIRQLETALQDSWAMEQRADNAISICEEFDYQKIGEKWRNFIEESIRENNTCGVMRGFSR